jgi:hypothetical protein
MEYAFWNTIHDGCIEAISGNVPGDITLKVGIEYLCKQLPTAASALNIALRNCSLFTFVPDGQSMVSNIRDIVALDVEVLSASAQDNYVSVICAGGQLQVAYEAAEIRLMEGTLMSQSVLEDAARRYWSEWSEGKHRD